jgi:hypothetical protein
VATNRRNFLRELVGQVARGAGELVGQALPLDPAPLDPDPSSLEWPIPGPAPARCASLDEVYELADEVGLARHRDAALSICRWSLRLTAPDIGDLQPASQDSCLLEIDLAWLSALGESGLVPEDGVLRIYDDRAPEWSPAPDTLGGSPALAAGRQLEVSPELVLPRAWSDAVGRLGLDEDELEAWETLRHRLAELQSTVPFDTQAPQALHRVLGYPEERRGDMPLACEMLANDVDLGDEPPAAHPRASEFEDGTSRWLLLIQLSADPLLGWSWGAAWERRYLWIHEADLATRRFERVRTFTQ